MTARHLAGLVLLASVVGSPASAACPPSCPLPGGGGAGQDCHAEFASTTLRLNFPPFDPARPRPRREIRCFDGDVGCDTDGVVNNECTFDANVCLLRSADPALPTCLPSATLSVTVAHAAVDPDLQALQTALAALLPHTADVCTTGQTLRVPLGGPPGGRRRGSKTLRLTTVTAAGTDIDRLKLTCVPRDWPSHGYNHANHRATPLETTLGPANAATLQLEWAVDLQQLTGLPANGVTSTPTVGGNTVYVTSWNGRVYALNRANGNVRWQYDTGSGSTTGGFIGVQSTAVLTPDGRVLVGDSVATVHCLNARTGRFLWQRSIGDPSIDHVWSSPQTANGRVFVGIASHNDNPCTQGRLVALDLDTGTPLWTLKTVPDRICTTDTAIACTTDADCGGAPGSCVQARGAGVTATVAIDPGGEAVYMNTVGCFTFPSVGDSDTIFKLDAATGSVTWKQRVQPPEQFGATFYHDFGFLNGPLLVSSVTGALVASGSKDGSLYALDPDDGSVVWSRAVLPTPVTPAFAGFGLFNAAVAFADQRFYAALYEFAPPTVPAPKHLQAFTISGGNTVWEDDIGRSWGSAAVGGGLVFVGTQTANEFYVYDAALGTRLKTFTMPSTVSSGASIVDGTVYVGYGVFGAPGGVRAYALP